VIPTWRDGKIKLGPFANISGDGPDTRLVTTKKEKKKLLSLIDSLDKKAEASPLSDNEINMKHYLKERLVILLREEEMKWYERAKVNTLLRGDDNTQL